MDILWILVPVALLLIALALKLLFWAVKSGQYDDLNTEGRRILFDEDKPAAGAANKPAERKP